MQLEFEWTVGQRKGSKLIYTKEDCQIFKFKSKHKLKKKFTCYVSSCKSRVQLSNDGVLTKTDDWVNHNHGSQEEKYSAMKIEDAIKNRAKGDNVMLHTVYQEECERYVIKLMYNICGKKKRHKSSKDVFNFIEKGLSFCFYIYLNTYTILFQKLCFAWPFCA